MKTCPECDAPIKTEHISNMDGDYYDEFQCGTAKFCNDDTMLQTWACKQLSSKNMEFPVGILEAAHLVRDYATNYMVKDQFERYIAACEIGNALLNLVEKTRNK
jgi:hypothetical protein